MRKLVMNQMESLTGGDDIDVYCYSRNRSSRIDAMLCIAEIKSGKPESGMHQNLDIDPLIAGCFAGGVFAILIGFIYPVVGRIIAATVTGGCAIAKIVTS